ncbi:HI1506-related protein [Nitrosospira sp. NpAV]|uniref:HI1506-related protein n=1 Tax=Nitrosospira sp. NpAV TaxID=58133 RepID=UPI0012EB4F6D|nr:HI1506-related protein [Nitrosospira sp. NpAV]
MAKRNPAVPAQSSVVSGETEAMLESAQSVSEPQGTREAELPPAPGPEVQKEKVVHALIVQAERNGFRRAGIQFGTEPVTLNAADLTPEQLDQIISEPLLSVAFIDIAAE